MARTPLPARTPLIGRERVLDALWGEVTTSAAEGGRVAVVRGPAGIGKTRLLDEFAQRARSLGAVVVAGRSSAVGGYPYGALADALAAYVRSSAPAAAAIRRAGTQLAQLVPALVGGEEAEGLAAEPSMLGVVQSAYRLVAQVTERRPMVLILDDVHAADTETCEVLHSLRRHAHERPWTLVLGLRQPGDERSAPGRRLVDTLRRDGDCLDVELEPLDQPGTAALATAVLGEGLPAPSLVEMLHRRTAGNPYYVEEMVRWFHAAGHLSREGLQWAPRPGCEDGVPPSIEEALSERISTLPAADRTVLEWICAAGGRAELSLLGDVGGLDAASLGASLEQLSHAQLVIEEGGGRTAEYRVRHPLVSECVYRDMALARRRLAHRALAFALSDRGAPAAVVATHFSRCAQVGDDDAIAAAMQAASEAESALHLARAVSWYQLALALLPGSDRTLRPQALERLSELASVTGHLDVGLAATQELLAHTPDDAVSRRLVMLHRLAGLRGGGGHVESTRAVIEEALALAAHGDPGVARMLPELTVTACITLPVPDVVEVTRRATEVADRVGARATALMLTSMRAHAMAYGGDPRAGADLSYSAGAEALQLQDGLALGCSVFARAVANTLLGRFGEAADALGVLGDASEQAGLQWESTSTWAVRSEALAQLGRFDEAVADSLRGEDFGRHQGHGMLELAMVVGAQALTLRGDLTAARDRLDEARRMLDRRQTTFEGWYWYARAQLAGASGEDPRSVVDACRRMWEWATLQGYLWLVAARPMQVHALLAMGDTAAALALAQEISEFLETHDIPRARPPASVALGAALVAAGSVVEGVTTALRGVAECDAIDGALIAATARLHAGEALVAAGERRRGVELLGEAHTAFAAMGSRWLRDRARAALRTAGVTVSGGGSAARTLPGAATGGVAEEPLMVLSPRERDVAMLAVSGSSSRSIGLRLGISERTVENHLANAYAKLRVHSRAELIALLSGGTPALR